MANVYRDEAGHFTSKDNAGGPCYHKLGRRNNKAQVIGTQGEREDITSEEEKQLREMGLEYEDDDAELDSDFELGDHEGQDRYEGVANILDNMVGPGGFENGVAKLKEMGINVPEEVGYLNMEDDGILKGYDENDNLLWEYDVNNQTELHLSQSANESLTENDLSTIQRYGERYGVDPEDIRYDIVKKISEKVQAGESLTNAKNDAMEEVLDTVASYPGDEDDEDDEAEEIPVGETGSQKNYREFNEMIEKDKGDRAKLEKHLANTEMILQDMMDNPKEYEGIWNYDDLSKLKEKIEKYLGYIKDKEDYEKSEKEAREINNELWNDPEISDTWKVASHSMASDEEGLYVNLAPHDIGIRGGYFEGDIDDSVREKANRFKEYLEKKGYSVIPATRENAENYSGAGNGVSFFIRKNGTEDNIQTDKLPRYALERFKSGDYDFNTAMEEILKAFPDARSALNWVLHEYKGK